MENKNIRSARTAIWNRIKKLFTTAHPMDLLKALGKHFQKKFFESGKKINRRKKKLTKHLTSASLNLADSAVDKVDNVLGNVLDNIVDNVLNSTLFTSNDKSKKNNHKHHKHGD